MDRQSAWGREGSGRLSLLPKRAVRAVWAVVACLVLAAWPALAEESCPQGPTASHTASQAGAKGTFALFSDATFAVHSAVGQVGTPYYYVLKKTPQGFTIVAAHLGLIHSPADFLKDVTAKAGL